MNRRDTLQGMGEELKRSKKLRNLRRWERRIARAETSLTRSKGISAALTLRILIFLLCNGLLAVLIDAPELEPLHQLLPRSDLPVAIPYLLPFLAPLLFAPTGGRVAGGASLLALLMLNLAFAVDLAKPLYSAGVQQTLLLLSAAGFLMFTLKSVSLLRSAESLLRRSYRNPVSGLPNRYKLMHDIALCRAPALALLKIERFNEINSCFGPDFGTEYLISIHEVIETVLNQTLSGISLYHVELDTFAILEEDSSSSTGPGERRHRFREVVALLREQTFTIGEHQFPVPVTAGISTSEPVPPRQLYLQAEQALTAALFSARSEMHYADSTTVRDSIVAQTGSLALVSSALHHDRVRVEFQPIMRNRGKKIEMYESLVRIEDESGKLIYPGAFLAAARLSSYHRELTRRVLSRTFEKMPPGKELFTVNIAAEDIEDPAFLPFLDQLVRRHPSRTERCVLEITEGQGIDNFEIVKEFADEARRLGYGIAVDDFGSGYSNFANIIRLPINYLKFDGSLVQRMPSDKRARTVLEQVSLLARNLKIKTVAEYVDSPELLEIVKKIGIDYSQGFLIGRPSARLSREVP